MANNEFSVKIILISLTVTKRLGFLQPRTFDHSDLARVFEIGHISSMIELNSKLNIQIICMILTPKYIMTEYGQTFLSEIFMSRLFLTWFCMFLARYIIDNLLPWSKIVQNNATIKQLKDSAAVKFFSGRKSKTSYNNRIFRIRQTLRASTLQGTDSYTCIYFKIWFLNPPIIP